MQSDAAPNDMGRYDPAANDPYRDPDDDPVIQFARRWLMPMAVIGVILAVAALLYVWRL